MTLSERPTARLFALDFAADLQRLATDFTGRAWVFDEIERWMANPGGAAMFLLTGEPGVGKSAIAAQVVQTRPDVTAYHFCIAGRNETIVPATVLRSLAAQLGEKLPGYGTALANTIKPTHLTVNVNIDVQTMTGGQITGVVINNLTVLDPQTELEVLLRAPLAAIPTPEKPRLILIDSLDEAATLRSGPTLVTLLSGLNGLPGWLRILCTSRPEQSVLSYFDRLHPYTLAAESVMNLDDIRQYITARMRKPVLMQKLSEAGQSQKAILSHLAGKIGSQEPGLSAGNFLFAKMLLNDIEAGQQSLSNLDALPHSLDEIYHSFLRRFSDMEWAESYQPLFGILAVALEPLTEAQLASFAGQKPTLLRQSLGVLRQFLDVFVNKDENETFRLFHQSLRDYLLDEKRSKDFFCAAEDFHAEIAAYYQQGFAGHWSDCDTYGLHHLPLHAVKADILSALLTEPDFWLYMEPAFLRSALESVLHLNERSQEISSVFSFAYPNLQDEAPPTRAAVLHLAALKQGAATVAAFFELALPGSPWHTAWTSSLPQLIPYRQRKTTGGVKAITAAVIQNRLYIVMLEGTSDLRKDQLSVWMPVEDKIRTTTITSELLRSLRVLEVGESAYIEIRTEGSDSQSLTLLAFEDLHQVFTGWNSSIATWVEEDRISTVVADFSGAVYLRPLGAPDLYIQEGNLQEGMRLHRNPETTGETPIVQLDLRVRLLQPLATGSVDPVLAVINQADRLIFLFPRREQGRIVQTKLELEGGTPKLREFILNGKPVLAILVSAWKVLLVDPYEGRLLVEIDASEMKTFSKTLHQTGLSLLQTADSAYVLITSMSSEVLFWNVDSRKFTHKHVFDYLQSIATINAQGRALVLTGHDTSIQVWNAWQLVNDTPQDSTEEVVMMTAASIDGRAMVAVLSWVDATENMRLTMRDVETGKLLYRYEREDRKFHPHFLALCQTDKGPCVALQSNRWNDEIEFHCLFRETEVICAALTSHLEKGSDGDLIEVDDPWWPLELAEGNFQVVSIHNSQENPSRGLKAFVRQIFAGILALDKSWADHLDLVVVDPPVRGLAATGFVVNEQIHENQFGLIFLNEQAGLSIIAGVENADLLATTTFDRNYIAVTVNKNKGTLSEWRPEAGRILTNVKPKLLLKLDTVAPILTMGTVAGQLLLAVGQARGVTLIPLSEGSLRTNLYIAERVTAISFAPQNMLIFGTTRGVEALRIA